MKEIQATIRRKACSYGHKLTGITNTVMVKRTCHCPLFPLLSSCSSMKQSMMCSERGSNVRPETDLFVVSPLGQCQKSRDPAGVPRLAIFDINFLSPLYC